MSFKDAVEASPNVLRNALKAGKQALKNHSNKVDCQNENRITGSIDIDSALQSDAAYAQASRWDYGLGYRRPNESKECAIWVEIHPADTSEVRTVVNKKIWLKDYLINHCPALWKITTQTGGLKPFIWVASNGVHVTRNSPQARLLAQHGLDRPTKFLRLP